VATTGIGYDSQTHSVTVTNSSGCQKDKTASIVFDFAACAGIEDNKTEQFYLVYPNPGDGTLHLLFKAGVKEAVVTACNLLGQNIWGPYEFKNIEENGEVEINLGMQTEGVYFIHITNQDSDSYTSKYIFRK
jgi:hypothetical protein